MSSDADMTERVEAERSMRWREYQDANEKPPLGCDIEQGWEAAWDWAECLIRREVARAKAEAMYEAAGIANAYAEWAECGSAGSRLVSRAAEYRDGADGPRA